MTSPLVLDLILLAILLFFVLMGAKRGFVLTLCSLVAVVVALVGANFLADTLTLCWACTQRRYFPLAVLTQIASLGGYHAYLVLRYAFPMGLGALMLLAVLLAALAAMARSAEAPG